MASRKRKKKIRYGYDHPVVSRPEFQEKIRTQLDPDDYDLVMAAYQLAKYGHKGQQRRDHSRYFDHCKYVTLIILDECKVFLVNPLVVGLLHDIKEESYILGWRIIRRFFGRLIYRGLRVITKEGHKDYFWGIMDVPNYLWWVILVKLADRLHNMRNVSAETKSALRKLLRETETIFPEILEVFAKKVPRRFKHLPEFFRFELEFAANNIRKTLGYPPSKAFKRVVIQ